MGFKGQRILQIWLNCFVMLLCFSYTNKVLITQAVPKINALETMKAVLPTVPKVQYCQRTSLSTKHWHFDVNTRIVLLAHPHEKRSGFLLQKLCNVPCLYTKNDLQTSVLSFSVDNRHVFETQFFVMFCCLCLFHWMESKVYFYASKILVRKGVQLVMCYQCYRATP